MDRAAAGRPAPRRHARPPHDPAVIVQPQRLVEAASSAFARLRSSGPSACFAARAQHAPLDVDPVGWMV